MNTFSIYAIIKLGGIYERNVFTIRVQCEGC